ncbi:hypothetical protein TRVL_04439 [Trypanosoma vivax]|nr:hypothetical protein TRVL_04439 [Trypanosoma vivax]
MAVASLGGHTDRWHRGAHLALLGTRCDARAEGTPLVAACERVTMNRSSRMRPKRVHTMARALVRRHFGRRAAQVRLNWVRDDGRRTRRMGADGREESNKLAEDRNSRRASAARGERE